MSWQKKISVGLYRTSLVLSLFFSAIAFLIFFNQNGFFSGIIAAIIVFVLIFGIIALLNWILRGFIG